MLNLTPRQLDVLVAVRNYRHLHGMSPTMQELADQLGTSKVTIFEHVAALEKKQAIRRNHHQSRSIEILLKHLPAAFAVMIGVCLITAAASLILVPSSVVLTMLPLLVVPVAATSMAGAALSTVMGSPDVAKMMSGLGADVMGFVLLARLVLPPALTVAALAPIFTIGSDPNNLNTARASNLVGYAGIAVS